MNNSQLLPHHYRAESNWVMQIKRSQSYFMARANKIQFRDIPLKLEWQGPHERSKILRIYNSKLRPKHQLSEGAPEPINHVAVAFSAVSIRNKSWARYGEKVVRLGGSFVGETRKALTRPVQNCEQARISQPGNYIRFPSPPEGVFDICSVTRIIAARVAWHVDLQALEHERDRASEWARGPGYIPDPWQKTRATACVRGRNCEKAASTGNNYLPVARC